MEDCSRRRRAVDALLLGGLVFAFFGPLLWAPAVYDDLAYVFRNPHVAGPWPGLPAFFLAPSSHQAGLEPLVVLLHRLLYSAWPAAVLPYRLTSLLIHWADAVLLLLLIRGLVRDRLCALAGAALFALFPAHSEVLAVSMFKTHLLAAFFCLAALDIQLYEAFTPRLRAAACWCLMALALLCKETGLLLAVCSPLLAWAARRDPDRDGRGDLLLPAGLLALAAAYLALRAGLVPPRAAPLVGGSWVPHLLTGAKCLLWYLAHLALPTGLCLEHSIAPVSGASAARLAFVLGPLAALGAAAVLVRADRVAGCAALWVLACLAPFLNVPPLLNYSLAADRYLYLASAGFFLLAARAFERTGRRPVLLLAALAAAAYATLDVRRAALFSDPVELWTRTAACAPRNPRAYANLGAHLLAQGKNEEALAALKRSLDLEPSYAPALEDLAVVYARTGRSDDALRAAQAAVRAAPTPSGLRNLGVLYAEAGRCREAVPALEAALAARPDRTDIAPLLADCRKKLGSR